MGTGHNDLQPVLAKIECIEHTAMRHWILEDGAAQCFQQIVGALEPSGIACMRCEPYEIVEMHGMCVWNRIVCGRRQTRQNIVGGAAVDRDQSARPIAIFAFEGCSPFYCIPDEIDVAVFRPDM